MPSRRGFLSGLIASGTVPCASWADAGSPDFVAAAKEPDGAYALFGLTRDGAETFRVALPARGHAAAAHPHAPEVVGFARRPGTYALVINCASGGILSRLESGPGREFNGHGVFSLDGNTLYTSEIVAATGEGRIGLWARTQGYTRVGDIASGGIGPHEICRLPGSDILIVANGGIRTSAGDRDKLNIDTMAPNLTYLTSHGELLQTLTLAPDLHHASIRHLSVNASGRVAFAMQWEGDVSLAPALLGLHDMGQSDPVLALAPPESHAAMQGYAGSVTFFDDGASVAISSPKGGRAQVFGADGRFAYEILRQDVCGVSGDGRTLFLTDGFGTFLATEGGAPVWHSRFDRAWDNHLVRV